MNNDIYKIIGNNIKKYRIKKGYKIEDLSLMTGINDKSLKKIEIEGVDGLITFDKLYKIANSLDINMIDLFKEKEE